MGEGDDTASVESAFAARGAAALGDSTPGEVVGDRFVLTRKIGEGTFGIVYEAADRLDGGRVALKLLRRLGPEWPDRFKREFRSLRDLEHPHLISLYELFFHDDRWFFTMELLDAVNLASYVGPDPSAGGLDARFDERRTRASFAQLASGLSALHGAGKVHRDVKPSNVLVTRDDRVVLLDLGLVSDVVERDWFHGQRILGTPAYMAPEQVTLDEVGPPADMYAVGVMLYEVLTGKLPFSADSRRILLEKLSAVAAPVEAEGVPDDLARLASSLLERDPRARPTADEVLDRVLHADEARPSSIPPGPSSQDIRLIGRLAELDALEGALAAASSGETVVVRVTGPSGIGKTALLRTFADRVRDDGRALVLASRCYERESVPFKAFDDLVESLVRHLVALPEASRARLLPDDLGTLERMFPVLRFVQPSGEPLDDDGDPRDLRQRAFAAFRDVLVRLGRERPVVLWLDDVQWADVDSAEMLLSLLRPAPPSALLVVLSHRPTEGGAGGFVETVGALSRAGAREVEIALGALSPAEARVLARAVIGEKDVAEACAELVAVETDGNPFFIKELASFVRDRSPVAGLPGRAELDVSLEQMILRRVRQLPPGAQRLLGVVSVAGAPISRRTAFLAAALESEAYRSLAALRSRQLVRTRGAGTADTLASYHDRIAETVVASLSPAEREAYHRDIAGALERSGDADAEVLAYHFRWANEPARAAAHALRAASQAASALAFDRAVRLYRLALQLGAFEGGERLALDRALGDALANAGHGKEAADVYLDAAARTDAAGSVELRRLAGEQLLRSGHVDDGFAIVEGVLKASGVRVPADPRAALLSLVARRAWIALRGYSFEPRNEDRVPPGDLKRLDAIWSATVAAGVIDTVRGAELQARHVLLALDAGEPYRVARALGFETAHIASQGSAARGSFERLQVRARALAEQVGHPHAIALCDLAEGMAASCLGSLGRGLARCDDAERSFRSRCPGTGWEIATARIFASIDLALLGEIRELRRRAALHGQEGRDRSDRYAAWIPLSGYSVLGRLAEDRPDELRAEIAEALAHWSKRVFTLQHHWASLGMAIADLYTGDEEHALARLAVAEKGHASAQLLRIEAVRINFRVMQIRCLLARDRAQRAGDQQLARLVRGLEREKVDWARPIADMMAAALAWRLGREDVALARLSRAVEGFESLEMSLFAAAARWRLGEIVGGDEGRAAVARSRRAMVEQTVARPELFARALAPALGARD